jgi:hypothetical protein
MSIDLKWLIKFWVNTDNPPGLATDNLPTFAAFIIHHYPAKDTLS